MSKRFTLSLTNISVTISENSTDCESDIHAHHILKGGEGGEEWTLIGKYKHHLVKKGTNWVINKMGLFDLKQEGNLKLLVSAA